MKRRKQFQIGKFSFVLIFMQTKNGFTKISKNNHNTKYDPKVNTKELQKIPIVINNCHKHQGYKRTPKFTPNNYT